MVVGDHEDGDQGETYPRRVKTDLDIVGAEARAHRAFFDDVHRRRQRTGAQQQRQVIGFARRHAARNLEARAELRLDDRRGDDFGLAFFDQQHRHAPLDRLARGVAHDARALPVELHADYGLVVLLVEAGRRVREPLARDDDVLGEQQGLGDLAVPVNVVFHAEGHVATLRILDFLRVVVAASGVARMRFDQPQFEAGRAAEQFFRARGVLHARQLHDDAVGALLLDDGLGHTQFVDAVAQRRDVLLEGQVLGALLLFRLQRRHQAQFAALLLLVQCDFGRRGFDFLARLVAAFLVAELDQQALAFAHDAVVRNAFVAQQAAHAAGGPVELLGQRGGHIDLQQEMHAAAQVEAQVHGQRADGGQGARAARHQVQRDDEVFAELLLHRVLGFQLRIGVGKPDFKTVRIERYAVIRDAARFQRTFDALLQVGIDFLR